MAEATTLPMQDGSPLYGLIAQFATPNDLKKAAGTVYKAGYRSFEAYSPFPIHHLAEEIGIHATRVPRATLIGGIVGASTGFLMQTWSCVFNYPLNVGGRPNFSWPSFIPITYELMILFAAISTLVAMLWANDLPRPYHPVFNAKNFERATCDSFFICIAVDDKLFDFEKTKQFLQSLNPKEVSEVYP